MFLKKLTKELAVPVVEDRSQNNQIMRHFDIKLAIQSILGREVVQLQPRLQPIRDRTGRIAITGCCQICNAKTIRKRRKTRKSCSMCKNPVCDEHAVTRITCTACHSSNQ